MHVSKEKLKGRENKYTVKRNGFLKFQYVKYTTAKQICFGEK